MSIAIIGGQSIPWKVGKNDQEMGHCVITPSCNECCFVKGKVNDIIYANLFFTLRNHPEWQKQCVIHPQNASVMVLKKGKPEEDF